MALNSPSPYLANLNGSPFLSFSHIKSKTSGKSECHLPVTSSLYAFTFLLIVLLFCLTMPYADGGSGETPCVSCSSILQHVISLDSSMLHKRRRPALAQKTAPAASSKHRISFALVWYCFA